MSSQKSTSEALPIVAYITAIGWIIALLLNNTQKSELTSFHLRQMLGIMLMYAAVAICDTVIGFPFLFWLLYIAVILSWVFGIITAIRKEKVPIPWIGEYFQEWFKML